MMDLSYVVWSDSRDISKISTYSFTLQTVETDIVTNFQGARSPNQIVVSDFAFVKDSSRNILVLGSSTDNDLVLVDMNDGYRTSKLSLASSAESTSGTSRYIEWAVDTNFVWVSGGSAEEVYIIEIPTTNIDDARVAKTLGQVPDGHILFVQNYEHQRSVEAMMKLIEEYQKSEPLKPGTVTQSEQKMDSDEDSTDAVNIIAIVVASIAVVVAFGALVKSFLTSPPPAKGFKKASESAERNEDPEMVETKTLGSKAVA